MRLEVLHLCLEGPGTFIKIQTGIQSLTSKLYRQMNHLTEQLIQIFRKKQAKKFKEAHHSGLCLLPWGYSPSFWSIASHQQQQCLVSFLSDLQTSPPNHKGITENTAIIAGVVAALILLVALTLLAVYYINTHPTVAPPFYLMQVRKPYDLKSQQLACVRLSAAQPLATAFYCLQRRTNNYWPSMKFRNQGCHSSYAEVELGGHEKEGFIEAEQCC